MGKLESSFQSGLIKDIEKQNPGCVVMKTNPNQVQGVPDLLVLYKDKWAALECKKEKDAARQPNQPYYVELMDHWSFARFVHPGNKEEVLYDLQQTLRS